MGLVEWLKVSALSSNPRTAKKKKTFTAIYRRIIVFKIRKSDDV
jgi:hypothetical protein